jgi:hypothetical protein
MALLKFKRSAVPAKVPALNDLALGELAINTYDGKVYTKKDDGTPAIVQVGGGGGVQTISSADGSVTITGTTDINLSVPVTAATNTVLLPVRNNTGSVLAKGTAVYINGALGQNPTVTKAIATGDATSAQTLGLVTANINNNAVGNVTLIGSLTNLDTSAYSDGQQLYLSPTTAGALTATKPYAPSHLVYMAVVEHAHPSLGKLFVKVQNGYEMDELHDVSAQNPANNDGLFYNTSTSLWEKKSIVTALGYTPANRAGDTFFGNIEAYAPDASIITHYNGQSRGGIAALSGGRIALTTTTSGDDLVFGYAASPITSASFVPRMTIDNGTGSITAGVDFRAPIFYDSNNTGYYFDGAGTTSANIVNIIGGLGVSDSNNDPYGKVAVTRSTGSNYTYYGLTRSGQMVYGMGIDTANQFWIGGSTAGADGIRSGSPYLSLGTAGDVTALGSFRAPIFYDSNNTNYYCDPSNTSVLNTVAGYTLRNIEDISVDTQYGIYFSSNFSTGYAIYREAGAWTSPYPDLRIAFHTGIKIGAFANYGGVRFYNNDDMVTQVMSVNNGSDALGANNVYVNNSLQAGSSLRAPIFYDSDNTAYYVDPNSNSVLNTLYMRNGTVQAKFAQASNFGYSSSYKTVVLGNEYLTTISMGVDVSGNASGSFNGQGEGREVLFRNGVAFITPNAANTAYETPLTLVDGYAASTGSLRAPIFYDSNNTGFYGDFASTSVMADAVIGGRTMSTAMHYAGFTLDANTMPSNSTGFTYGVNAPFVGPIMRAGQPAGGGYDLWLNAPYGGGDRFAFRTRNGDTAALNSWQYPALYNVNVNGGGALYATIYYDQNNTGYYVNPDGTSNIYQLTGAITHGSYGSFSASGSYNGYAGVAFPAVGVTLMANQGASGFYFNDNTWGMYCNSSGSMYSRIFYDLNDTGYYCDPTSGSVFNRLVSITGAGNSSGGNLQLGDKTESTAKWSVMTGAHYNGVSQAKGITLIASYGYATGNDISIGGNIYEANPATYIAFYTATSITHPTGGSNRLSINGDGNVTANVDIRAPIYYDSNNTAFYVDGNNGTRLNALYPNAIQTQSTSIPAPRWDCSFYVLQSQHWYSHNGASTMYVGESGDFVYIRGYTTADGSSRAPIFYDNQNTSYYVDPSSTGTSLNVAGNIDCIARSAAWSEGLRVRVPSRNTWGGIRFTRDEANSNGNWAIGFTGIDSTDDLTFWGNVSGAEGMRARLTQGGNFTATGNVTAYSDARLKQEVETIKNALDLVSQMRGVTYTRKDTGEAGVGVIAQEMREIMPQVVLQDGGDDGTLSVAYGNLVGVLIEAVKELTLKVKTLEEKDN